MNRKPIIGIVTRCYKEDSKSIIKLNEEYRLAIIKAGGIPLLISPTNDLDYGDNLPSKAGRLTEQERRDFFKILSLCDGFLSTGGDRWYDYDEILCQYAYDFDKPYLGICLGMQILGNFHNFNKKQVVDKTVLNETEINHLDSEKDYVHNNYLLESKLLDILGCNTIAVNSRHRYHITKKDYFKVSSYSEDGLIEAIEIPNKKFIIGVQWHPESMLKYDDEMLKLFKALVDSCR